MAGSCRRSRSFVQRLHASCRDEAAASARPEDIARCTRRTPHGRTGARSGRAPRASGTSTEMRAAAVEGDDGRRVEADGQRHTAVGREQRAEPPPIASPPRPSPPARGRHAVRVLGAPRRARSPRTPAIAAAPRRRGSGGGRRGARRRPLRETAIGSRGRHRASSRCCSAGVRRGSAVSRPTTTVSTASGDHETGCGCASTSSPKTKRFCGRARRDRSPPGACP